MKKLIRAMVLPLLLAAAQTGVAAEQKAPAIPTKNIHLADSPYQVAHGYGDFTPLAGLKGPSRVLKPDEITWKPIGPVNGYAPIYSNPYPNGKRVIWVGGYDRIVKLDADTLDILTTYAIGGNTYWGEEEINRYIKSANTLNPAGLHALEQKTWREPYKHTATAYRMISKDNELYIPHIDSDGSMALRVYADADPADPASEIILKREWKIPPKLSKAKLMSVQMTYDGWVLTVTQDGVLIALSQDFSDVKTLKLPRKNAEPAKADFFAAFVRNGLTVDDNNGIYVVSRDYLHRVQWTGKKLSMREKDGAWKVPYNNEFGTGSGTTPTPMGWGPDEDHLVVIADGAIGNNIVAYWRDEIPADWQGLSGHDKRVAGVTKMQFGIPGDDSLQVENAPVIWGYGVFFNNFDNTFVTRNASEEGEAITVRADDYVHIPGHDALGAARFAWDPASRTLNTVWRSQRNFANTVSTISGATGLVYSWGYDDGVWSLQGTDWNTGEKAVAYVLGKSKRYDAMGGPIIVDHTGGIICACSGGMGIVRVNVESE